MSEKPSLYVVEKKEVIILVVLFVLVTVLSFTLGVRYGESVGRKIAVEQTRAEEQQGGEAHGSGGGTLGKNGGHDEQGSLEKHEEGKEEAKKDEHGEHKDSAHEEHGEHKDAAKGEDHGEKGESPEGAAKKSSSVSATHEAVDKNSDEYLLNALKDAGVEPPGGKSPKDAKLPESVKEAPARTTSKARSGSFVIQVGSHPTQGEAEAQVRSLKAKKVSAEILPPFKDRQGEWHRVVISGFKAKRDAEKEASALKSRGSIVSYFVWRLP